MCALPLPGVLLHTYLTLNVCARCHYLGYCLHALHAYPTLNVVCSKVAFYCVFVSIDDCFTFMFTKPRILSWIIHKTSHFIMDYTQTRIISWFIHKHTFNHDLYTNTIHGFFPQKLPFLSWINLKLAFYHN